MARNLKQALGFLGIAAGFLLVQSCRATVDGISPFDASVAIPGKELVTTADLPVLQRHFVRTVLHVDVEKYNPLNALDYSIGWLSGGNFTPHSLLFEYVVLGHAYLDRDDGGYVVLRVTPALRRILENTGTYISPLTLNGIKVLVEVRSGKYGPDEDGIGLGFGTMDMSQVDDLFPQLQLFVRSFGIDGFEFNDEGGGRKSFPPHTRSLREFATGEPMYPDSMFRFQDEDGNWQELGESEIDEILWREGGQNFTDFLVRVNDRLRESRKVVADFGGEANDDIHPWLVRHIMARNNGHAEIRNHGGNRFTGLSTQTRAIYEPDAYTGATAYVVQNLRAIVNDFENRLEGTHPNFPFLQLWNPFSPSGAGMETQGQPAFAPFIVNLSVAGRMSVSEAQALARRFAGTQTVPHRFGTLYFSNLPTLEEDPGIVAFLTAFTGQIFGIQTFLREGGGNRPRPTAP